MPSTAPLFALRPTSFQELLARARAADSDALDALFEEFYPTVRSLVHRSLARDLRLNRPWLTTRFSTGDLVQEVFRSVLRDLRTFGGTTEASFVGFLTTVVRNRLVDAIRFHEAERRDGRRSAQKTGTWGADSRPQDPAEEAASAEQVVRMYRALQTFSERERHLLRARIEGLDSFKNLAEQLGYGSETAARRAFYGAQARLAILLEQE